MPLQITEQEIKRVRQAVEMELGGRSVGELMESGALGLSRRTLQRRLDLLVKRGDLIARGEGRGRRYFGTALERERVVVLREEPLPYTMTSAGPDWMSEAAKDIRARVTAPLFERKPVGYQRDFLNAYEPNETFYLPEPERETLHRVGQVKIDELPAGTYLRQVLDRLLIDLSWNSSRLEGNTYSLLETQRLLEEGRSADGKRVEEAQMILNHKAAIEMLADQAEEIGFNAYTICNLHALLSDGLLQDPAAGGRVRTLSVGITGTVFHPLAVPQELERFFQIILEKAAAIRDPFEQAFFMMVQLPYLQPFEDVNKRVSRLAANISLVQRNLCPLSFTDVTQDDYVSALL
ncbi:MAG: Fic family protein, partial [Verrucomicrobiota bacterium]